MPLTAEQVIEHVLQPERDDARTKSADPDYWGDTGVWVQRAVVQMEAVFHLTPCLPNVPMQNWLGNVIQALELAHENFRREEDDPDGYGSATFHQTLNRLRDLYGATPENS